jgi:hypothetical protein
VVDQHDEQIGGDRFNPHQNSASAGTSLKPPKSIVVTTVHANGLLNAAGDDDLMGKLAALSAL